MKPVLSKLCGDSEFDVRYYAEEAKQGLQFPPHTVDVTVAFSIATVSPTRALFPLSPLSVCAVYVSRISFSPPILWMFRVPRGDARTNSFSNAQEDPITSSPSLLHFSCRGPFVVVFSHFMNKSPLFYPLIFIVRHSRPAVVKSRKRSDLNGFGKNLSRN